MERVFLIGGSGFVGKNFVDVFDKKYEIHVFDRYIDEDFFAKYNAMTWKLDLVNDRIPEDYPIPDYIINLSSIINTSDDLSLFDQLISSNLKVLLNLYEQYKGCESLKLFVQFGSSEEYGTAKCPFMEDVREEPVTPYALVKQLVVNTSMMLYKNYRFPIMAVRPGNLFGRFQNPKRFIPYVITQLYKNEPLDVSLCEQKRDFMYCNDFVAAIDALMENSCRCWGNVVNVSSGQSYSLRYLIELCSDLIGSKSEINYGAVPYKANEIMDLNCSIEKLTSIANQYHQANLKEGIEACVEYYTNRIKTEMGGGNFYVISICRMNQTAAHYSHYNMAERRAA